jgi:hypothetical protein
MERKYGCLESPKDLRDYRPYGLVSSTCLPTEYSLSNTTIKDQGTVNSCVAHALSSMLEKKTNINFSTAWIYGYRPDDYYQGEGMYPREALKTLLNKGAVKNSDFNFNIEMTNAKKIVDNDIDKLENLASSYKIDGYARLSSNDEIKTWLYTKNTPVPIAIATDNLVLDDNNIIQIPKIYPSSGHAIIVIGWNETGFIIQNSWGESWGDKGLAILPYDYEIREAWGVTYNTEPTKNIAKPKFNLIRTIIQKLIGLLGGN